MSFDLIIKNGTVILENEARVVDIAVKGGKIAAIGQDWAMQRSDGCVWSGGFSRHG